MLDDQAPQKGKILGLTAPVLLEGDITGLAAIGMWALAGAASQHAGTDGLMGLANLVRVVPDRAIAEQLAHLLVVAGLWHEHGHDCPRCDPVPERSWRYHDWWDMRYKPDAVLKVAQAKSKENKRPEVVNAVWLRDCVDPTAETRRMAAHCRYCGKLTKRSDRTPDGPQLDHVDPTIAAGASNLVVACGPCNRAKGSKPLSEAGMTLRPAPRTLVDPQPGPPPPPPPRRHRLCTAGCGRRATTRPPPTPARSSTTTTPPRRAAWRRAPAGGRSRRDRPHDGPTPHARRRPGPRTSGARARVDRRADRPDAVRAHRRGWHGR